LRRKALPTAIRGEVVEIVRGTAVGVR